MTKSEKMFALVEQWKSSGQTQKVFCQEHDLKLSTFGYWIAKQKRTEESSGGFVPIEVGNEPGHKVEITYPNGVRVAVASRDLRLISRLIGLY